MSTPRPRPTVVTSPRSGKTSPPSSARRNGVSTADPPSIGAVTKVLPPGYPPCHGGHLTPGAPVIPATSVTRDPSTSSHQYSMDAPSTPFQRHERGIHVVSTEPEQTPDPRVVSGAAGRAGPGKLPAKPGRHMHGE